MTNCSIVHKLVSLTYVPKPVPSGRDIWEPSYVQIEMVCGHKGIFTPCPLSCKINLLDTDKMPQIFYKINNFLRLHEIYIEQLRENFT